MLPYAKKNSSIEATAGSPTRPEEISGLLGKLSQQDAAHVDRNTLLYYARSLVSALETPRETLLRICWAESINYTAINIALDLDLFHKMQSEKGSSTVSHLSVVTGADPDLLSRLMRHYAAIGTITETGTGCYCLNSFSRLLATARYADGFAAMSATAVRAAFELPSFLRKNKYINPSTIKETPLNIALKQDLNLFDYLREEPLKQKQFNEHMSIYSQGRTPWFEYYPVREQLIAGKDIGANDILLVDIGGNTGHDLLAFKGKWPDAPGYLVLQDRAEVLASIRSLDPVVHAMEYNFLTEQPVKGARAYYMHSILHDWNDEICQRILTQVVKAMKHGYSKLLIEENVVPDVGADWEMTSLDLMMMTLGAAERTEKQWRELIESTGLRVIKVWGANRHSQSLIECQAT